MKANQDQHHVGREREGLLDMVLVNGLPVLARRADSNADYSRCSQFK